MDLKNVSNYPVTVNGVRIETGETADVEIEDVEYYEDNRRFKLEDEDDSEPDGDDESDDVVEEESSKPKEEKIDETGD